MHKTLPLQTNCVYVCGEEEYTKRTIDQIGVVAGIKIQVHV